MDLVEQIQPLSQTQIGIIKIVKSAMKSTKETLPDGFDWKEAQQIVTNHSIEGLAYFGLKNMGMDIPDWLKTSFLHKVVFLTRLWDAAEIVMKAFNEAGVEYKPLKGISMKDRYPDKYMRYMSDVDILIHENEYE